MIYVKVCSMFPSKSFMISNLTFSLEQISLTAKFSLHYIGLKNILISLGAVEFCISLLNIYRKKKNYSIFKYLGLSQIHTLFLCVGGKKRHTFENKIPISRVSFLLFQNHLISNHKTVTKRSWISQWTTGNLIHKTQEK